MPSEDSGVLFLRGMNVGGHRVTNDRLVEIFSAAGVGSPTPYQASGNVMFSGELPDLELLEDALEYELGYEVPLTVRNLAEIEQLASAEPFAPDEIERAVSKPQAILLFEGDADPKKLASYHSAEDLMIAGDRHVYWLPAKGVSESTMDFRAFARDFGTHTIRTQGTLVRLLKKLS